MTYSLIEYQKHALRTHDAEQPARDALANYTLGLAGEAGEVANALKKHLFHGHPLDAERVVDEIGDVLWYAAALAHCVGYSLETVARRNVDKLRARYPGGFSSERSRNREE